MLKHCTNLNCHHQVADKEAQFCSKCGSELTEKTIELHPVGTRLCRKDVAYTIEAISQTIESKTQMPVYFVQTENLTTGEVSYEAITANLLKSGYEVTSA